MVYMSKKLPQKRWWCRVAYTSPLGDVVNVDALVEYRKDETNRIGKAAIQEAND